eukprot:3065025-Alexandrium_andersonii.AAC.1
MPAWGPGWTLSRMPGRAGARVRGLTELHATGGPLSTQWVTACGRTPTPCWAWSPNPRGAS